MKFRVLAFLLVLFQGLWAQSSLLWEVSGNGLSHKSYIFGTIHLIPASDYFFPKTWQKKLYESDVVVFESDIKPSIQEQLAIVDKVMFPSGQTLRDYVPAGYYDSLYVFLKDTLGLKKKTISKIMKIKPAYASALVLKKVIDKKLMTYETEIYKMAKKKKKKFYYLETLEYQTSLIDSIPIYEQARNFLYNPENGEDLLTGYYAMVSIYKTNNIDSVSQYVYASSDSLFLNKFIRVRNENWLPQLERLFKEQSTFVAVGSGHLGGKYGILTLLKSRGYKLRPVSF